MLKLRRGHVHPHSGYGKKISSGERFKLFCVRTFAFLRRDFAGIGTDCLDLDAMELMVAAAPGPAPALPADVVPLVVPAEAFAPVNARNTIFLQRALWGLLLPSTVAAPVSDIWRGYWAQSLLHSLGGHVAFVPSPAALSRPPLSSLQLREQADLESPLYLVPRDPDHPTLPTRVCLVIVPRSCFHHIPCPLWNDVQGG